MKRKAPYKNSAEILLHQPGDKTISKFFFRAETVEQAVAHLQNTFPEKNYCMANVILFTIIPKEQIDKYLDDLIKRVETEKISIQTLKRT